MPGQWVADGGFTSDPAHEFDSATTDTAIGS